MRREKIYFFGVIAVVILLLLGFWGLKHYKAVFISKIEEGGPMAESDKEQTGQKGSFGGQLLPVTDNPDGSNVPGAVGQIPLSLDEIQVSNSQKGASQRSISLDVNGCSVYRNKKYQYSFKYPSEFDFRECASENPCRYGQILEKDGGNLTYLSAQTDGRGWPYVAVAHYDNESFTLGKDQKLIDWFKTKFRGESVPQGYNYTIKTLSGDPKKAVRISFPPTPQAYSKEEIYFAEGNNVFQIQLLDTNKSEAWNFYNPWLESFVWEN